MNKKETRKLDKIILWDVILWWISLVPFAIWSSWKIFLGVTLLFGIPKAIVFTRLEILKGGSK